MNNKAFNIICMNNKQIASFYAPYKERIFELRFSRKPNGRGLGLSISKEVLNAENYDIFVAQPKEGSTVTFKIQKMQ